MNYFKDKTVAISGGTGYLGKNLTRKLLSLGAKVRAFSRDGGKVEVMQSELQGFNDALRVFTANARDKDRMLEATDGCDILIVAHAEKRINICEENKGECFENNYIGARNLFRAARLNKIKKIIFISTDKAEKSYTVYGDSKKMAEDLAFDYNNMSPQSRFAVVRYGNIWDSTDSVIRKWDKLYPEKELLITNPDMTRFYMCIDKAVELILNSIKNMKGGEMFYKKGMKALRISDIIKHRYPNAKTRIIGLRCREKMHEEIVDGYSSEKNVVPYDELIKELE